MTVTGLFPHQWRVVDSEMHTPVSPLRRGRDTERGHFPAFMPPYDSDRSRSGPLVLSGTSFRKIVATNPTASVIAPRTNTSLIAPASDSRSVIRRLERISVPCFSPVGKARLQTCQGFGVDEHLGIIAHLVKLLLRQRPPDLRRKRVA